MKHSKPELNKDRTIKQGSFGSMDIDEEKEGRIL
jgi:hypothetical protein